MLGQYQSHLNCGTDVATLNHGVRTCIRTAVKSEYSDVIEHTDSRGSGPHGKRKEEEGRG